MPSRDLYDVRALYAEVRRRAEAVNATVNIQAGLKTASTDGKVVNIPAIGDPVSDDALTLLRYQVIHECGHLRREGFFDLLRKKKIDMRSKLGTVINIVEDEVQERVVAGESPGDAKAMGLGRAILHGRSLEAWRRAAGGDLGNLDENSIKFCAAHAMAQSSRDWDSWSLASREALIRNGPPQATALLKELLKEEWIDRIKEGGPPSKVLKLSRDLFKRLFPDSDEDEQQEQASDKKPGDEDAEENPANSREAGDEQETKATGRGVIPWQDFLSSTHDADPAAENRMGPGAAIDWRGYGDHHTAAVPMENPEIVQSRELDNRPSQYSQVHPYAAGAASALAERTRILLQSLTRSRWLYGQTSGRLNKRVLGRLALPVTEGSDSWRKVFKQKRLGLDLDVAVSVLMDISGSMSGSKMNTAGQCLMRLHHVLARALRLPLELLTFSASYTTLRMQVVKSFNDRSANVERVHERMNTACNASLGGNADGDAIFEAMSRLLARREERKVLIVLSDGAPSSCNTSGGITPGDMLHAALRTCRNRGVEVYGIGIETTCTTEFYGPDCKMVQRVDELDAALLATIKSALLGGRR